MKKYLLLLISLNLFANPIYQWQFEQLGNTTLDMPLVWEVSDGDKAIKVAILSTGVDISHRDLRRNLWTNNRELRGRPGIDDDGNGLVDDIYGYNFHDNNNSLIDLDGCGTAANGIIGATHDNFGIKGVLRNVSLMNLKIFNVFRETTPAIILSALEYAQDQGAQVILLDYMTTTYEASVSAKIKELNAAGVPVVVPAGDSSLDIEAINASVIPVAAHTRYQSTMSTSNRGEAVILTAPGHEVISTIPGGGHRSFNSTLMAAAHLVGAFGHLINLDRATTIYARSYVINAAQAVEQDNGTATNGVLNMHSFLNVTNDRRFIVEVFETPHPYADNALLEKTFTFPGATSIKAVFARIETERNYDEVQIFDGNNTLIQEISGSYRRGLTSNTVPGDTIKLKFTSDYSSTRWGVLLRHFEVQF